MSRGFVPLLFSLSIMSTAHPLQNGREFAGRAPAAGIGPGEIDIRSRGVTGKGVKVDSASIEAALRRFPHGKFYFSPGTYLLDNTNKPGIWITGFSGSLRFAPGAVVKCMDVSRVSRDCVAFTGGSGLTIDGLEISYLKPTPQKRSWASGAALHLFREIAPKCSNIKIDGSSSAGIYEEQDVDAVFENISIKNSSADGFSSVNSKNTQLAGLTTDTTLDDGLSVINYQSQPDNRGFRAHNVRISRSAARGIAVPGQSDVKITDFSVKQTCAQGVLVFNDVSFNTRTPENVEISHGEVEGAGHYTHEACPCANPAISGIGVQYTDVRSVSFDHIKITDSTFRAFAGNTGPQGPTSDSASIRNIEALGPNVGGFTIYNTKKLELKNISLQKSNGGFFISDNVEVTISDVSATNVRGFLNRAFDFENNGKVEANRLAANDDQENPTGNEFLDYHTKVKASYKSLTARISKGSLKVQKSPNTIVEVVER